MRTLPVLAALALLAGAAAPAEAQTGLQRLRVLGRGDGALYQVRDAAYNGGELVVLSAPAPALHLFGARGRRSWGARGRGPAELANPQNAVWLGGRILVRDAELQKIASYDRSGNLVGTRPLRGGMVVQLEAAGADTLVAFFNQQNRLVVRLRGARQDTVLRYSAAGPTVHLSAPGAPSLTLAAPYTPLPTWTALPDGRLAFWDGRENAVRLLDRAGRTVARLPLPATRYPVTAADREAWFDAGIPSQVRGQRVFEPLRQQARREVRFPEHLPPVLALRADPSGGVWVQQTPGASGQRWVFLAQGQPAHRFQLPPGHGLLAVGPREIAVLARDADDVESIHIYANPRARVAAR